MYKLFLEIARIYFTSGYLVFLSYFTHVTLFCQHSIGGAVLFFQPLKHWIADFINFVWLYHTATPGLFFCNEYGKNVFSFQCTRTSHLILFISLPLPFKLEARSLPWKCVSFSMGLQSLSKPKAGCSNPALSFGFLTPKKNYSCESFLM